MPRAALLPVTSFASTKKAFAYLVAHGRDVGDNQVQAVSDRRHRQRQRSSQRRRTQLARGRRTCRGAVAVSECTQPQLATAHTRTKCNRMHMSVALLRAEPADWMGMTATGWCAADNGRGWVATYGIRLVEPQVQQCKQQRLRWVCAVAAGGGCRCSRGCKVWVPCGCAEQLQECSRVVQQQPRKDGHSACNADGSTWNGR